MADPTEIDDAIKVTALEPKQVTGDQGSITNQSIRDMIVADKYLRGVASTKKSNRRAAFRNLFQRISPPSARG